MQRIAIIRRSLPLLVCLIAGFVVFAFYFAVLKQNQPTLLADSYEYAQVARNIAQGKGIVTSTASILEVSLLGIQLPLPYFYHDPGQSVLISLFFKAVHASDTVLGWSSGIFFILLIPLMYAFGRALFGRRAGAMAALLALVNTQLLVYSTTGYSEAPYAFLLTLTLFLLWGAPSPLRLLGAGLVFGLTVLVRSNSLPFLFWLILWVALAPPPAGVPAGLGELVSRAWHAGRAAVIRVALFVSGFAVVFVPNALRNWEGLHHPLYNLSSLYTLVWFTSAMPGKSLQVFNTPGPEIDSLGFILAHPEELLGKIEYQLGRTLSHLMQGNIVFQDSWSDAILIVLFLLALIAPPALASARHTYSRWLLIALIGSAFAAGLLLNLRWRHLYGFIPMVLIYVAELVTRLLDTSIRRAGPHASRGRYSAAMLAVTFLVLVLGLNPILANIRPETEREANDYYRQLAALIERRVPPLADVFIQPLPEPNSAVSQNALAWYTLRNFIRYGPTTQAAAARDQVAVNFLLVMSTDKYPRRSLPDDSAGSRYQPVERWISPNGNVAAILYERNKTQ